MNGLNVDDGATAGLAARLGVTESQVWSMGLGLVFALTCTAIALPGVVWRTDRATASPSPVTTPTTSEPPPVVVPTTAGQPSSPALPPPSPVLPTFPTAPTTFPSAPVTPEPQPSGSLSPTPVTSGTTVSILTGGFAVADGPTFQLNMILASTVPKTDVSIGSSQQGATKIAFLRLRGGGTTLTMPVDQSPLASAAKLRACPILVPDWRVGHGDTSLATAPAFDCSHGLTGKLAADGSTFSFTSGAPLTVYAPFGLAIAPDVKTTDPPFDINLTATSP